LKGLHLAVDGDLWDAHPAQLLSSIGLRSGDCGGHFSTVNFLFKKLI